MAPSERDASWRYFNPCRQGSYRKSGPTAPITVTVLAERQWQSGNGERVVQYLVVVKDGDAQPTTVSHRDLILF